MKERINEKIKDIEKYLFELEEISSASLKDFKSDLKTKAACERYFEKIVESLVDLVFLIIKHHKFESPNEDSEAFVILERHGVIDKLLSEKLQDAKNMRNLIIHQYEVVDDERVYEAVKDKLPSDAKEFIKYIKRKI